MAGLFKKNPKKMVSTPTRGPRVQEGIDNFHGKKSMLVSEFVARMEIKVRGAASKTYYEKLREERIAKITKYQANLKNISNPSVEEHAARIGKDLKTTLLERKQDNQKAAKNIAANAYKANIHR